MKFKTDIPPKNEDKDQVKKLDDFIEENFSKGINNESETKKRDEMLIEAKNLLLSITDSLEEKKNDLVEKTKEIIKKIENTKVEKETLFLIIKSCKNLGIDLSLEDIASLELLKRSPEDFSSSQLFKDISDENKEKFIELEKEKADMMQIYRENYEDNPELRKYLLDNFNTFINISSNDLDDRLSSMSSEINILKYKNKVVSFNSFTTLSNFNKLHFKAFNTDVGFQNSGIGRMMLKATLDQKAKDKTILAECITHKPITPFYIENGFIATKSYMAKGAPILDIVRKDKEILNEFKTKNLTKQEILEKKKLPVGTIIYESSKQEDCNFDLLIPENFQKSEDKGLYKAKEKYVLTRYFFDEKSKKWVTVFEETKRDLEEFI